MEFIEIQSYGFSVNPINISAKRDRRDADEPDVYFFDIQLHVLFKLHNTTNVGLWQ